MIAIKLMKTDQNPSEIIPRVFLGSIGTALLKHKLHEFQITHILCAADKIKPAYPAMFEYKAYDVLDTPE